MKGQDILLLLKLVSLEHSEQVEQRVAEKVSIPNDWRGWASSLPSEPEDFFLLSDDRYSVRGLEHATGISKSEISAALRRCYQVGLARPDRRTGRPRANTKGLLDFISYGLKYVLPAHKGHLTKGIPTAAFAPVLAGQLFAATGGEHTLVWEDAEGTSYGQRVEPIFKSVTQAVRNDPMLYALLALVDSIRLGSERESALSKKLLQRYLGRDS